MWGRASQGCLQQDDEPAAAYQPLATGGSLEARLLEVQTDSRKRRRLGPAVQRKLAETLPAVLWEREFKARNFDKAFACEWMDDGRHVLFGTKCNHLVLLDTRTGAYADVPLPARPHRPFSTVTPVWGACGIHSIAFNPSRDLMATSGADPADCAVFRADGLQLRGHSTLVGHRDWVFGVAWLSDRHLVTGSRDGKMCLWSINREDFPDAFTKDHKNAWHMFKRSKERVREVKYDRTSDTLASLDTAGWVVLHDTASPTLRATRKLRLHYPNECVCMGVRTGGSLLAVGSMNDVELHDPRAPPGAGFAMHLHTPDKDLGVRSVSFAGDVVSFGTGGGRLCFFDLRANRVVPADPELRDCPDDHSRRCHSCPGASLPTGPGWVDTNESYWELTHGARVPHACYAHAWDPSGTRLFACGGPLAFGLRGCYLALWE